MCSFKLFGGFLLLEQTLLFILREVVVFYWIILLEDCLLCFTFMWLLAGSWIVGIIRFSAISSYHEEIRCEILRWMISLYWYFERELFLYAYLFELVGLFGLGINIIFLLECWPTMFGWNDGLFDAI